MWFSGMLCLVLLAAWLSPTPVSSFGPLQNNYAGLNQRLRLDMSAGVYLHVPFCRRRCFYCDFPIQVVGDRASTQAAQSLAYEQLLLREIAVVNAAFQRQGHFPEVDSIYFGGGTPSLLLDESIDRVLDALRQSFRLSTDTEITLEMDPGTFNQPRLNRLQGLGINRVSVGVQSFDQTILNRAGRAHSVEDVYTAVDALHGSRIQNFNIDLISSLPFLTLDLWDDTLRKAIDCKSTHLSVYDLQVEEKTAFGRWYTPGSFPLPAEESCVEMYKHASSVLCQRGGFEHYEVSNYAKGGHRSRHNQKYWRLDSVYGFGMAAASYCGNVRFTRPNSMQAYTSWLEKIEGQKELLTEVGIDQIEGSKVDPVEFIMLALRTKDGLSMSQLQSLCGEGVMRSVNNALQDNVDRGLVFKSLQGDGVVFRLADPEGFIVSNDIISSVLAVID